MIAGVIIGAPTLRLRGDYLALVTMGFGEIIRIVARNSDFTGGVAGRQRHPASRPGRVGLRRRPGLLQRRSTSTAGTGSPWSS